MEDGTAAFGLDATPRDTRRLAARPTPWRTRRGKVGNGVGERKKDDWS